MKNQIIGSSQPNPELVGTALAVVLKWADENDVEPVSEAELVAIVGQYEGDAEPTPFVVVEEPLFVERRKVSVS